MFQLDFLTIAWKMHKLSLQNYMQQHCLTREACNAVGHAHLVTGTLIFAAFPNLG